MGGAVPPGGPLSLLRSVMSDFECEDGLVEMSMPSLFQWTLSGQSSVCRNSEIFLMTTTQSISQCLLEPQTPAGKLQSTPYGIKIDGKSATSLLVSRFTMISQVQATKVHGL